MRKLILWAALVVAVVGGSASRTTGYGRWVGSVVTYGGHWWLPIAVFFLLAGALAWSLADRSPDLVSMFAVLTLPSVPAPFKGGLIGWAINWPWNALNGLLAGQMPTLTGKDVKEIGGIASLCWFIAISVGLFALVRWLRKRAGKGGGKASGSAPGGLAAAIAAAKGAK